MESKKANSKAKVKFILLMVVSLIVGGIAGYLSVAYGLDALLMLKDGIKAGAGFFGVKIAPWLMLALAVIMPVIAIRMHKKATKLLAAWDGEDEEVSDAIDEKLSIVIWITGSALIIAYFLIAASYSGGLSALDHKENIVPFFVGIAAFLGIMVEGIIIQQKCLNTARKTNPEKDASVYDMKFQKKWMDSCDEAEKILVGKCSFKAYSATNTACSILAPVFAISALIFGIGFLPTLIVCVIWIVNQSAYCKEALRYSKAGNRIM